MCVANKPIFDANVHSKSLPIDPVCAAKYALTSFPNPPSTAVSSNIHIKTKFPRNATSETLCCQTWIG